MRRGPRTTTRYRYTATITIVGKGLSMRGQSLTLGSVEIDGIRILLVLYISIVAALACSIPSSSLTSYVVTTVTKRIFAVSVL
jgi:hypothetical protein